MHKEEMDEGETERKLLVRLRQMCWGSVDTIGFELLKSWRFVCSNSGLYLQAFWIGGGRFGGEDWAEL
jgi:hypothetical protein